MKAAPTLPNRNTTADGLRDVAGLATALYFWPGPNAVSPEQPEQKPMDNELLKAPIFNTSRSFKRKRE